MGWGIQCFEEKWNSCILEGGVVRIFSLLLTHWMRNTQYTSSVCFEINVKSLMSCVEKLYVSRISLLILVFKRQGSKTFNQDDRDDVDHSMSVDRHCHSFVGLIATPQVDTVCIKEFFYLSWLFSIFVQIFVLYFSRFVCVCPDFFIFVLTFFNRLGLFIFVCWPMVSDHSMSVDWICHSFVLRLILRCWGKSSILCQQNSDAL